MSLREKKYFLDNDAYFLCAYIFYRLLDSECLCDSIKKDLLILCFTKIVQNIFF